VSQPSLVNTTSEAEVPAQKQQTNVYTVMLIISFICIVTACALLYAELTRWGSYPWWSTSGGASSTQSYYMAPNELSPQHGDFA
jgi:hypothetical protein